jgi:predicted NBD/HSP70 family sugar kinase
MTTLRPVDRALAPARVARAGEALQLVRRGTAVTISELAAQMRVARSTVNERVDLLLELGLLMSQGEVVAGRGRPAMTLRFRGDSGVVLAAQLGMSGIRVGVSDLAGQILATRSADVEIGRGPEEVLSLLEAEFDSALEEASRSRREVFGIGLGIPGRIELETAPDVGVGSKPWHEQVVEERLAATFGVPTVVGRGIGLLSMAEYHEVYPHAEVLLGVKVGTVIECGVVIGGRVIAGGDGLAGEIGHTPASDTEALCACGNRGCLNAVAGGAALAQTLSAQGYDVDSAREVARLAQEGVVTAGQAVRESGRRIGEVLAGAVNLLNPNVIVVWGYLADAGDQLFAGLRESLYRVGVPASTQNLVLARARLGDDAGIRGAITVALEEVLTPTAIDRYILDQHAGGRR